MLRRRVVLAAPLVVLLTGCSAAGEANPEKVGPRGVDELTIPTPSPDPDDFVGVGRQPVAPAEAGPDLDLRRRGQPCDQPRGPRRGRPRDHRRDHVRGRAQHRDRRLGRGGPGERRVLRPGQPRQRLAAGGADPDRSWRAGEDGAEAGLAMPAEPRVGDGFAAGARARRRRPTTPPCCRWAPRPRCPPAPSRTPWSSRHGPAVGDLDVTRRTYAEGTGLVEALTTLGGTEHAELVSVG